MSGSRLVGSHIIVIVACLSHFNISTLHADDLLDSVRQAHRASIESIRTMSCRTSLVYNPKVPGGNEQGEYWRDGNVVRCKYSSDGGLKCDVFIKNGLRKSTDKIPPEMYGLTGTATITGSVTDTNKHLNCDPYLFGLIMFPGKTRLHIPFEEFLSETNKVNFVRRVDDKGRPLVLVDVSHARGRLEIWFDPAVNYLVRRRVLWSSTIENLVLSDQEVMEFQEGSPGIYFPKVVKTTANRHDSPDKQRLTATFSNLQINRPISPEAMTFKFAEGLKVIDTVLNQVKVADANGEPTKPALTEDGEPITLLPGLLVSQSPEEAPRATQQESESWTRWLLPASLGVFGLGAVISVSQWWRKRKGPSLAAR